MRRAVSVLVFFLFCQTAVSVVISYLFGPLVLLLLSLALVLWVGYVVADCWVLSPLNDHTLALVCI